MVIVAGSVPIQADKREQALAYAREMGEATRGEAGCIRYEFSVSVDDPNRMLVFEVWADADALTAHFQTPHMATFRGRLPEVLAGPTELTQYEVAPPPPGY